MQLRHTRAWATLASAALTVAAAGATSTTATAGPASCANRSNNSITKLLECVTVDGVREHQAAFQAIADANNGTRVSGSAGYDASVDYVADDLQLQAGE